MNFFDHNTDFTLENGTVLPSIRIAYDTYGKLNEAKDNVVWVCHALTASSDAADWWKGLVGEGCFIDPEKYFIVCANMPGSCYGSTILFRISYGHHTRHSGGQYPVASAPGH